MKKPPVEPKVAERHARLTDHVREVLISRWVYDNIDIKKIAEKADLSVITVDNFLHRITQRPKFKTVVQIADALGLRIGILPEEAPLQPDEIRVDQGREIRKRRRR